VRAADPYADNPFPVPYRTAPSDSTLRWAGFQSRVGTYLPTDPYHFWRFDPSNRAETQDVYWREEMMAETVPLGWNGSFTTLEPGKTTQAWRNAVLREVTTSAVNQSVKRNAGRFPRVSCFQLTREGFMKMLSQSVITSA
jgi:hypothetical protein